MPGMNDAMSAVNPIPSIPAGKYFTSNIGMVML